jgi:hypothetical protein
MADRINELLMAIETLRTKNTWPRRPLWKSSVSYRWQYSTG